MDFSSIKRLFKIKEDHGDKCKAICPAHPDKEASLSISYDSKEGKTLLYCHAGCETKDILDRVGLKITDLFDQEFIKNNSNNGKSKIEVVYQYQDEKGNVLFEKVRFKPKKFSQRRYIDGLTFWGLENGTYYETFPGSHNYSMKRPKSNDNPKTIEVEEGIKPVLYNLPALQDAIKRSQTIYIVEGEKDADNVNKLGLVATCNFDGASKSAQRPKWRKEYNETFRGATVVLIPDNDDPGRAHMENIAKNLQDIAESIRIVNLPEVPEKGDTSDWIELNHTKDELLKLVQQTSKWVSNCELENDLDLIPVDFNSKYLISKTDRQGNEKITVMPVMENIIAILNHYNYQVKFNEINRKVFVFENNKIINEIDQDTIYKIKDKCVMHHLSIAPDQLKGQLYRIGIENTFNPVNEYLLECRAKWNGESKLDDLYKTLECDKLSEKFKAKYIRKMLVTAVALILSEDISNSEGVLVLAGNQGIGKTRWFKSLLPKKFITSVKELYFLEGKELILNNKDSLMECTASWFTELGELSSTFKKSEIDDLKNFITRSYDRFRAPYSASSKDYKRRTVFVATVNDEEFLNDDTGSRRWWVLRCNSINYNHGIDIDKIWGEAVYLWETGKETTYFTSEEQKEAQEYNKRFESLDSTALLIMTCFDFSNEIRYWMRANDVFDILGRPNNFNTKKLGVALGKLNLKTRSGAARTKYYAMPPVKKDKAYTYDIDMKNFERANYVDMNDIDKVMKYSNF